MRSRPDSLLAWWAFSVAAGIKLASAQAQNGTNLAFGPINFAGYNNYVYRDSVTAVQAVLSSNPSVPNELRSRFLLAFPRGNTGVAVFFEALNGTLVTNFDNTTFASVTGEDKQVGFTGQLTMSSDARIGKALIGSVRTLRDYIEGNGTENAIFNYTLGPYNESSVTLVRNWINGSTVQYFNLEAVDNFNISVTPNSNATLPPDVVLLRPDPSRNGTLAFTCTFNYTNTTQSFIGLGGSQLFLPNAPSSANNSDLLDQTLEAIAGPGAAIANQTAFLSYEDVFFAGGWRFLTFFGRDTLLSLRLLLPTLTSEASEGIMRAVIERTRTEEVPGQLCHEETVGDYASFVNIQNNQSYLGDTPSYNYVMADTDFLLLPVLADYFLSSPQGQGRAEEFLNTTSNLNKGTLRSLLRLNVDHVMNLTAPFVQNQTVQNLIRIRDPTVGNWRDSSSGLGYGKFPFDINTAFVPAALRAIAALSDAGLLPSNYSQTATTAAEVWETSAYPFFEVTIDSATAQARLDNYIQQANLTNATIERSGSLAGNASPNAGYGNVSQIIGGQGQSTFYALSLLENGTAVEVLNSDLGFVLEYGNNVSASIIRATIEALQPYPRGLLTTVGMVVANAAYDSNTTNIETFDNRQYHGAVAWSWTAGIMAKGIAKQLSLAGASNNTSLDPPPANATMPTWAEDASLVAALKQAETRLWDSIQGAASVLYTEVWSPLYDSASNTFTIGDLGAISPTGTEGDAVQLWSYGFLGLVDPRTRRPVAAGL